MSYENNIGSLLTCLLKRNASSVPGLQIDEENIARNAYPCYHGNGHSLFVSKEMKGKNRPGFPVGIIKFGTIPKPKLEATIHERFF